MMTKPLRGLALVTVVTAVALLTQVVISVAELTPSTPGKLNALETGETDYGTQAELVVNAGPLEVGRYFFLKPVSSPGLCVSTAGSSRARGVKVQQSACSTSKEYQRIYFRQVGADNYQLAFQHSAQCLRVAGGSLVAGAPMVQDACARTWTAASAGTVFTLIPQGTATPAQYQLKSTTSGMCLKSPNTTGGSQLVQGACTTTARLLWSTTVVPQVAESDANGRWSDVIPLGTTTDPVVAAAAAVRPDGQVVGWSSWGGQVFGGSDSPDQTVTVLFDPTTNASSVSMVTNTVHDMFCPGTSLLDDGRLHVSGGDTEYTDKTSLYDPATGSWEPAAMMTQPRWYSSSVTLADGRVLTLGGNTYSSKDMGDTGNAEIYDSSTNTWAKADGIALAPFMVGQKSLSRANEHIRLLVAPDGRVIATGPTKNMQWISTSGTGAVTPAGTARQ